MSTSRPVSCLATNVWDVSDLHQLRPLCSHRVRGDRWFMLQGKTRWFQHLFLLFFEEGGMSWMLLWCLHTPLKSISWTLGSGLAIKRPMGGFRVKGNTSPVCPGGVAEKRPPSAAWKGRTRAVCVLCLTFMGRALFWWTCLVGFEPWPIGFQARRSDPWPFYSTCPPLIFQHISASHHSVRRPVQPQIGQKFSKLFI